jgi:LPXTG-site transpeptidase (sortase) family protein
LTVPQPVGVRPRPRRAPALAGLAVLVSALLLCLAGCSGAAAEQGNSGPVSERSETASAEPSAVPTAHVGLPAKTERISFVPTEVVLPGHARAAVLPAQTVDGVLRVPENVRHVGWWDGSAYAGDPFGSVVIAGHVDSATEGLGFFARLRGTKKGEVISVRAGSHVLRYRVTGVKTVAKQALATDSAAFDQTGSPRLVLITCGGAFHRDQGGYDSNLLVIGTPIGLAR